MSPTKRIVKTRGALLSVALSLTMTCGLIFPGSANAIFASEITQLLNNISLMFSQFQDYYRYVDDAVKWKAQIEGMRSQVAKMQNMGIALGIKNTSMKRIDNPDSYMVAERCGKSGSVRDDSLFASVDVNDSIPGQQYSTCKIIQQIENRRYNSTVDFMEESFKEMERDFDDIRRRSAAATEVGDSNKVAQDASAVLTKHDMRFKHWESLMMAYKNQLEVMQSRQIVLGRAAMRGNPGRFDKLISVSLLGIALCGGGKCDQKVAK